MVTHPARRTAVQRRGPPQFVRTHHNPCAPARVWCGVMALEVGAARGAREEVRMGAQSAEAEFDAFYRDTARRVVHLVYGFTGDLTVAQDATQEAYARA